MSIKVKYKSIFQTFRSLHPNSIHSIVALFINQIYKSIRPGSENSAVSCISPLSLLYFYAQLSFSLLNRFLFIFTDVAPPLLFPLTVLNVNHPARRSISD